MWPFNQRKLDRQSPVYSPEATAMPTCSSQYIIITPDAIQSHGYDEVELINEALIAKLRKTS